MAPLYSSYNFAKKFREINFCILLRYYVHSVESTLKRYHAEIFSVKSHIKNLLNQLLQMHVFLPLGNISRPSVLNKF